MSTIGPEEPDEGMPDHLRAQADALLERFGELDDDLRQIGLYVEGGPQIVPVPTPLGERMGLLVQFQIGKVAFSQRVQHPEDARFEDKFDVMAIEAQDDAFLDERQRIADALARGEDPYAVDDDDDG